MGREQGRACPLHPSFQQIIANRHANLNDHSKLDQRGISAQTKGSRPHSGPGKASTDFNGGKRRQRAFRRFTTLALMACFKKILGNYNVKKLARTTAVHRRRREA